MISYIEAASPVNHMEISWLQVTAMISLSLPLSPPLLIVEVNGKLK
jgi:hypothetical protein